MTAKLELRVDDTVARRIIGDLPQQVSDMLRLMAADMTLEMKESMGTGGDYRLWPSKVDGSGHWSAPPYKSPNPDTHDLLQSLAFTQHSSFTIDIHDAVRHGVYQELGTTSGGWGGGGHAPRPFMRPVFKRYATSRVLARYAAEARLMRP